MKKCKRARMCCAVLCTAVQEYSMHAVNIEINFHAYSIYIRYAL
jgi:hypothetical protein